MKILSLFIHPQICRSLYIFLRSKKEDILKNVGNQTVSVPIDFLSIQWPILIQMEQIKTDSLEYLLLCSTK